ncbi:MAG: bifunctional phosphopantothenoylcysteine decarboxylase/phosphopantothenate--cysteine ligase CoaBC [Cetobacterium sp.]|uniref:bifunctional phosphopantothenoylcysteine decarboxylase/phosphopantothenate--cysteine ligase CoaBC n=1 Tax=unclassified Cetobacterium TaxID=2630983 RepID=UPI00163B9A03|nr:bifunctional phosphopantothenoylcysteine decarboxylase/phosphopantothenate--cysteine ligase CoaBC [Cetobacterium sp. 2A]MBC2856906.1 bifunctional phosphopantothenoylcysteine decarboxylase/phosphopantothenate--cysteine ligase CoaBC [Cetobacterium sp. 2A]
MKNILLGVTGGIAAYKSANIVSILKKRGYNVKVIMTESATNIITPQTLETLSRNNVITDMWERGHQIDVEHISLADWADLILVAPATLNIVGKVANGIADDMLTTVISAARKPVFFALAMNVNMYNNPILKDNIKKLESYGYNFIEADEGFLACNINSKGRLKDETEIVNIIEEELFPSDLKLLFKNKKILITAGRTEEPIDPVRYLSNRSSGQMGYGLAEAAVKMGADVTLISGPTELDIPKGLDNFIRVRTAEEMYLATIEKYSEMDIAIACAAVADYKPKFYSTEKIKKSDGDLVITLDRNPDILLEMGKRKDKQFLVGFAAETENIIENAVGKLKKKNLNLIIANNANNMQKSTNEIYIIDASEEKLIIPEKSKKELAYDILKTISKKLERA